MVIRLHNRSDIGRRERAVAGRWFTPDQSSVFLACRSPVVLEGQVVRSLELAPRNSPLVRGLQRCSVAATSGFRALVAAVFVVGLTACSASGEQAPLDLDGTEVVSTTVTSAGVSSEVPSRASSGSPQGSGAIDFESVDVRNAIPVPAEKYEALFDFPPPNTPDDELAVLLEPTDDGVFLGTSAPFPDGENLFPAVVTVIDTDGVATPLATPPADRAYQVIEAAARNGTYVWRETSSTNLFAEDFRILSSSAGSDTAVLVADSDLMTPEGSVLPTLGDAGGTLATDGTTVFWAAATPVSAEGDQFGSVLYATPVDGTGETLVLAENVVFPIIMGDRLLALRYPGFDLEATRGTFEVVEIDRSGGGTVTPFYDFEVDEHDRLTSLCATPTLLAFGLSRGGTGTIHVRLTIPAGIQIGSIKVRGDGTQLACGDGFLAWGNGSGNGDGGEYLLDLANGDLYKLGDLFGFSVVQATGDTLLWAYESPGNPSRPIKTIVRWKG